MTNKMKYAYYPGCVALSSGSELDVSTRRVCKELAIDLVEIPEFSCCGAGVLDEVNSTLNTALNARNLAICEDRGLDMMTICSTCQGMIMRSDNTLKNDVELAKRVNKTLSTMSLEYTGKSKVRHLLMILAEDYGLEKLQDKVVRPLTGVNVAAFYGCHIIRPGDVVQSDSDNPKVFEDLISILGADPVWYDGRVKCCGFPVLYVKENVANKMAGLNLLDAKASGADVMATPCPLCHISLDTYQANAEAEVKNKIGLPVLHLPQLIGLALGIPDDELGIERHLTSAESFTSKIHRS